MTVLEQVRDFLTERSPSAFCDDCIAREIGISPRQHANHKTRELASEPLFERRVAVCAICGKTKKVIRHV